MLSEEVGASKALKILISIQIFSVLAVSFKAHIQDYEIVTRLNSRPIGLAGCLSCNIIVFYLL